MFGHRNDRSGHGHHGNDREHHPHLGGDWGRHGGPHGHEGDGEMFGRGRHGGGRGHGGGPQGFGFGHGGGPFGFGGPGRPGRPKRPLEQGDLRWLVLDLISTQPRHGYEIIKAIEEMFAGQYTPSPGVVYPTLTYLEETGLLVSEAQGTKKLYSITDEGTAALDENADALKAMRDRIDGIRARFGGAPAPELMRAMNNLRSAIQIRMGKGEVSPESLASITAAIDRAASEIERS